MNHKRKNSILKIKEYEKIRGDFILKRKIIAFLISCSFLTGILSVAPLSSFATEKVQTVSEEMTEMYLSTLEWTSQNCGASGDFPNGTAKNTAVNGEAMSLYVDGAEFTFTKGLGAHAPSEIVYDIADMGCTKFEAYAGVDLQCLDDYMNLPEEGIIGNFIVLIDDVKVVESGEMNPSMNAYHFKVDVPEGAKKLTLKAVSGSKEWSDWIIWGDAKITVLASAMEKPVLGPTIEPIMGNNISVHVVEGIMNLYRGETLLAQASSLGKVTVNGTVISDFVISNYEIKENVKTDRGEATRLILEMTSKKSGIIKTLWYDLLEEIDGAIVTTTFLTAKENVTVKEIVENEFTLVEPDANRIWSYNGGGEGAQSYYDTLQKVNNSFYRANKQDDTAAAIPVADIYSVKGGITVGDASLYRRFLTTPVQGGNHTATVSIHWNEYTLKAGQATEVGTAIVGVHSGDYYNGLRIFADVMEAQGFATPEYVPETSYDLRWESWGWEGAWTIEKILGKLDELYAQGIRQITLDDCWYTAAGDWELNPDKFPNGVADMKRLTDTIHEKGMTIILWWRPMDGGRNSAFSVISGHTQKPSKLITEHPEYFVKNADGSFAKLSGPGSSNHFNGSTGYALCPYSEGAVESQVAFIRTAMTEWGIDGFKSDYVWGVPKCYNKAHNHARPEESTEMASDVFYKAIYEEMISIDPDAFHLLCNCGTPQDYYSFPYVTQIPTADPTSVDQTRRRVKAYKALAGDDFPITTDHNEIWYPSSVGTGAILIEKRDFADGSAQEMEYYKWLGIAEEHQLHKGTHIGDLYSYGIDSYETYVIEKDGMMYYSFYKDGSKYRPSGNPEVVLKGLDPNKKYKVEDYVNGIVLAEEVAGDAASFTQSFGSYLLVRAIPLEEEEPEMKEKVTDVFSDVYEEKWYVPYVQYVYDHGLMSGNDKIFNPTGNVTRAQVVTTLYRLAGSPEVTDYSACTDLKDVKEGKWYTNAICWAYSTGVTTGDTSTMTFNIDTPVTRQQLASFFYRYAEYMGYDISISEDTSDMLNADQVASYAKKSIEWAVGVGLISGSETLGPDGIIMYDLAPKATATRGQLAAILQRFCEKYDKGNDL